jgi:hypothetical protein
MEMSGQLHATATLSPPPRKERQRASDMEPGGLTSQCGRCTVEKIMLPLPGIKLPSLRPLLCQMTFPAFTGLLRTIKTRNIYIFV